MEYFDELSVLFEGDDAHLFKSKSKKHSATPDDRLIDTFGEITLFVRNFGHLPDPEAQDIREASLGISLNTIRTNKDKADKLAEYDELGILELDKPPESLDELFAADSELFGNNSIFSDGPGKVLSRPSRPIEERADRKPVDNFEGLFKDGFIEQQRLLSEGKRRLIRYGGVSHLRLGGYYVHDGQMLRIVGETEKKRVYDRNKERFRIIYENGTESNMYRRSLSQRLREDGYTVVDPDYTPEVNNDEAVGRIYILKSLSEDPKITSIANLFKIGVTAGSVANRVKNAANDPTYLMSPVKIVEDYRVTGVYNPQKLEDLIHKIFGHAQVDLSVTASDGSEHKALEWYSVPLSTVVEALDLIASGEIINYHYDSSTQRMIEN